METQPSRLSPHDRFTARGWPNNPWLAGLQTFVCGGRRWYLLIALAPLLAAAASAGFVSAVDPYDLRPWGATVHIADGIDPQTISNRLIDAVSKGGYTHVLIGGSTVMRVTPAMMRRAFGTDIRAFNISFPGIRPADLTTVLERLRNSTSIKRILIAIDATMLANDDAHRAGFPIQFYHPKWYDVTRDFDWNSVADAARLVWTSQLSRPPRFNGKPMSLRQDFMSNLKLANETGRAKISPEPTLSCDAIPAISDVIGPAGVHARSSGQVVDLFFPPYYLAQYSNIASKAGWYLDFETKFYLANVLKLRECVVTAAASSGLAAGNVHVHGFDDDMSIVADASNYRDPGHIMNPDVYEKLLQSIAKGTNQLTPESWPAYADRLKTKIQSFEVPQAVGQDGTEHLPRASSTP